MSIERQVSIGMSQDTVNRLIAGNYALYGFKAVRVEAVGYPLVWFRREEYDTNTIVAWDDRQQAYTSMSQLVPGGQIIESHAYSLELDQTLLVTSRDGTGIVETDTGRPGAVSIRSGIRRQLTCGIAQAPLAEGSAAPTCAFPLHGRDGLAIFPVEHIILMFYNKTVAVGTTVELAFTRGIWISLTDSTSRSVTFDFTTGWSWNGEPWGALVRPWASMIPLLNLWPELVLMGGRLLERLILREEQRRRSRD